MGDGARNCKRVAEMAATESSRASFPKKMKIHYSFEEFNLPSLNFELRGLSFVAIPSEMNVSLAPSLNSDGVLPGAFCSSFCTCDSASSCFSSNESSEVAKDSLISVDLEARCSETDNSTCINNKFSRDTTPSAEFCGDTDDMDSKAEVAKTCRRKSLVAKMPTQEEIDEFFAVTEKKEQHRFAEKYNYDIVNDMPLEGRYQWVRLKP